MLYPQGTQLVWKGSSFDWMPAKGTPAYVKDGEWWRSLMYDLDKPLDKRYGVKLLDEDVPEYFGSIMDIILPPIKFTIHDEVSIHFPNTDAPHIQE